MKSGAFCSSVRGIERMVFRFDVTSSPINPLPRVEPTENDPLVYSRDTDNPSILGSTIKTGFSS